MNEEIKLLADMLMSCTAAVYRTHVVTMLHMSGQHEKANDWKPMVEDAYNEAVEAYRDLNLLYTLTKEMKG